MYKYLLAVVCSLGLMASAQAERLKDLATIQGVRTLERA